MSLLKENDLKRRGNMKYLMITCDSKGLVKDVPNLVKEDKTFSNFRKRVAIEPEQVKKLCLSVVDTS